MRIELPRYFGYEFVLDEQKLRAICSILVNQIALITTDANDIFTRFELKISDLLYGYEASSEIFSLDEVFLQDNGDVWIIRELKLTVYNKNHPDLDQITVEFKKSKIYDYSLTLTKAISTTSGYSAMVSSAMLEGIKILTGDNEHYSVRYLIVGSDRDWINQTNTKLVERLAKVTHFQTNLAALGLIVLAILVAFIGSLLYFTHVLMFSISIGYIITFYFVLFLLLSLGITLIYGFPPHNFYWGEYKSYLDKKQSRAKYVIAVVIIGLAISVFGAILSVIITK